MYTQPLNTSDLDQFASGDDDFKTPTEFLSPRGYPSPQNLAIDPSCRENGIKFPPLTWNLFRYSQKLQRILTPMYLGSEFSCSLVVQLSADNARVESYIALARFETLE